MGLIDQARSELALINFGDDDSAVMIDILERFFKQWDSGGAVWAAAPVLQRLIAGQPLSPLSGDDAEWVDVSSYSDDPAWQNARCSSVFKDKSGRCYDIDIPGRPTITFPYDPTTRPPPSPVVEIEA